MVNVLSVEPKRKVNQANFSFFQNAEKHPDRIMPTHDLVYILEGTWVIGQDSDSYEITAGDIILLQAGHFHYGVTLCTPGTRTMFIHFTPTKGDSVVPEQLAPSPMFMSADVVVHCGENGQIKHLFEDIIDTYWSDVEHQQVRLSALLSLLLWEIADGSGMKTHVRDPLVDMIIREINRNPERFYTIQEISSWLYVSEKTITSHFKQATNRSIHQYQIELKLDMVRMQMQIDPKKYLKELATAFGFYDEFHLSRLFKRKFGMTPGDYKRIIQEDSNTRFNPRK